MYLGSIPKGMSRLHFNYDWRTVIDIVGARSEKPQHLRLLRLLRLHHIPPFHSFALFPISVTNECSDIAFVTGHKKKGFCIKQKLGGGQTGGWRYFALSMRYSLPIDKAYDVLTKIKKDLHLLSCYIAFELTIAQNTFSGCKTDLKVYL